MGAGAGTFRALFEENAGCGVERVNLPTAELPVVDGADESAGYDVDASSDGLPITSRPMSYRFDDTIVTFQVLARTCRDR